MQAKDPGPTRPRAGAWAAILLLTLLPGCTRLGPTVSGTVDLSVPGSEPLRLVYLGTGGWILERADDQVLTGPLFSNPGFVRSGLWTIRADTLEIDRHMSRYDVSRARAILVGHAHYDHLMDVPRVALRHAPDARILGSATVAHTLGTWSGVADRVHRVDAAAGDSETPGRWIPVGSNVRVMPLRSFHAPHFNGMTLYEGHRRRPLESEPSRADEWVSGDTFAYLIDFLDGDGSVAFRVYYQDAVAPPPAGLAPAPTIAERSVDVAIIVPATFDQVDWHPEALVENLDPARVILGHWEDFFTPVDERTQSVLFTDHEHFGRRLEGVHSGPWWRPELWTEFLFPRR